MTSKKSYSEMDTFGRCPWKYKLKYIDNLQPQQTVATLHEGTIQHLVIQEALLLLREYPEDHQWDPYSLLESLDPVVERLQNEGKEHRFPAEQSEHDELVRTCVRRMFRWLEAYNFFEEWELLHIEEEFEIELDNGHVLTCTPDLVARNRMTGDVWVFDIKTVSTVPDEFEPTLQTRINLTAVKSVYPETVGFIFDTIRKKEPVEPELIKDGTRISRLNQVDTDFRTLSDFIERVKPELFTDQPTLERLAELREIGSDKWFKRFPHYMTPEEVENTLADVSRLCDTLEVVQERELWYRVWQEDFGYKRCTRCSFYQLCVADLKGQNTELVINQFYEPRDTSYKEYEEEGE